MSTNKTRMKSMKNQKLSKIPRNNLNNWNRKTKQRITNRGENNSRIKNSWKNNNSLMRLILNSWLCPTARLITSPKKWD